jgi:Holliday junction resolvasome RuvABC endonuclease subunit
VILAFDLATTTGYCYGAPPDRPHFGHFRLPKTGSDVGRFLIAAEQALGEIIAVANPTLVVFEAPILVKVGQLATLRKLYGLAGMLEVVASRRGVEVAEVSTTTVKKALTGSGRADKSDMIRAAQALGFDTRLQDEADAIGVWVCAARKRYPEIDLQFER